MMFKTLSQAATALALAATMAAPVRAAEARNVVHVEAPVSYADLDIGREPGARALLARIKTTAQRLCHRAIDASEGGMLAYQACVRTAVADAVMAIDSPMLNSLQGGSRQPVSIARSN